MVSINRSPTLPLRIPFPVLPLQLYQWSAFSRAVHGHLEFNGVRCGLPLSPHTSFSTWRLTTAWLGKLGVVVVLFFSTGENPMQGMQALMKNGFMVLRIRPVHFLKNIKGFVRLSWRRMVVAASISSRKARTSPCNE